MCGIAGILHYSTVADAPGRVGSMTHALIHRGPDAEGYYNDPSISLGHRRLSIIDLSDAANQPFHDYAGRYVLVFNGEIYNFRELKKEIKDYPFITSSDTEVLMAAFCKWGISCLSKLDGMFAFAIWDTYDETLWLARDRMGVKPLYYNKDSTCISFSSEKRSLMKSGFIKAEIDQQSMFDYLSFQSTGYPNAIIKGIHQVKAGTYVKITNKSFNEKTYWDITEFHETEYKDLPLVRKNVFNLLHQAVQKRRISDVDFGILLSGGIDSSAIAAMMSLGNNQPINTFTLGNSDRVYDESVFAERIAKRFSTNHTQVMLNPDVLVSKITEGLNAMDSPTADGINTYLVSSAIRGAGFKVALSGIGGDELFVGYPGFMHFYNINKFKNSFHLSYLLRQPFSFLLSQDTSGRKARLGNVLSLKNPTIDRVYPILREILSPKQINQFIETNINSSGLQNILYNASSGIQSFELFGQFSIAEYLGYSQQTLLKDTDQMSMALGLEIREPFFDYKLIEYVMALPDHIKYPHVPKKLLVDSIYPMLPVETVSQTKRGFLLPWNSWMRNELFSLCDFHIRHFSQRDFVHAKPLLEYWQRFLKNDPRIRWMELWQIVVLDFWMQKNMDSL